MTNYPSHKKMMKRNLTLKTLFNSLFIITFMAGCSEQTDKSENQTSKLIQEPITKIARTVDSEVESVLDLDILPDKEVLLLFTDTATYESPKGSFSDAQKSKKREYLSKFIEIDPAYTTGEDEYCYIAINNDLALGKYGSDNIDLLVAHEIGHCHGPILSRVCKSKECDLILTKDERAVSEQYADFIGIYKLALKEANSGLFDKKNSINHSQSYDDSDYDYSMNASTLSAAKTLFDSDKRVLTDEEIAKEFVLRVLCVEKNPNLEECER